MTTFTDLGVVPGECRIVVEAGNCNGDLAWAIAAVDAAADTGAVWGFKAQFYNRERLVTRTAPTYGHDTIEEPDTQWEHFARQMDWDDWYAVKRRCDERGLVFFASVFDDDAVADAEAMEVPLYKIASADITHRPLLEQVAATGKPIVLSTGGATLGEIHRAVQWIADASPTPDSSPILLMVCTLAYPTPSGDANLMRIPWWQDRGLELVGWSDHTQGISAMLTARHLGAVMIEKHFTITPGIGGDHDFAITPDQFTAYAACPPGVGGPAELLEMGTDSLEPRLVEHEAIMHARRSIAARVDIAQGNIIRLEDLDFLRPGTGAYQPYETDLVVGKAAPTDIPAGTLIPPLADRPGTSGKATITANLTVE